MSKRENVAGVKNAIFKEEIIRFCSRVLGLVIVETRHALSLQ